ncbi:hypothetical protein CHFL109739_05045 [Chryseobacterium flavum]
METITNLKGGIIRRLKSANTKFPDFILTSTDSMVKY